jgi:hypothetical protein
LDDHGHGRFDLYYGATIDLRNLGVASGSTITVVACTEDGDFSVTGTYDYEIDYEDEAAGAWVTISSPDDNGTVGTTVHVSGTASGGNVVVVFAQPRPGGNLRLFKIAGPFAVGNNGNWDSGGIDVSSYPGIGGLSTFFIGAVVVDPANGNARSKIITVTFFPD